MYSVLSLSTSVFFHSVGKDFIPALESALVDVPNLQPIQVIFLITCTVTEILLLHSWFRCWQPTAVFVSLGYSLLLLIAKIIISTPRLRVRSYEKIIFSSTESDSLLTFINFYKEFFCLCYKTKAIPSRIASIQ